MNKLNLIATIVPLLIVAIGLIGWVTTLRGDLNVAHSQIIELKEDIVPLQEEAKQCAIEIHNLHKLIADLDEIQEVTDKIDVLLLRVDYLEEATEENYEGTIKNDPTIEELKRNLAIANDQMKTIMADHQWMGEKLNDLKIDQPAGERREYGGYGGK